VNNQDGEIFKTAVGVRVVPFDSSIPGLCFQAIHGRKRAAIDGRIAALLDYMEEPKSKLELVGFCGKSGLDRPEEAVTKLLETSCIRMFIGQVINGQEVPVEAHRSAIDSFPLKFSLIKPQLVKTLASPLIILFDRWPACVCTIFILFAHLLLAPPLLQIASRPYSISDMSFVIVGVYASLFLHELGHSAACLRFGAKPGSIGIGIYWIWPVMYADLADGWRLRRSRRVAVDCGGIYVQMLISAICLVIARSHFQAVLHLISASIMLSTVINLNPFLRFDGYWVITDLLGVPSLRLAGTELGHWLFSKATRTDNNNLMYFRRISTLPVLMRVLIIGYGLASLGFYGYWTVIILKSSGAIIKTLIQRGVMTAAMLHAHPYSIETIKSLCILLIAALGAFEISMFIYQRSRRLYSAVSRHYSE
jgi:hypothetical protein